jgi:acyl-CoA carboxylase subunit alpha
MIEKLLVANRGEIARRITRTAHEMGIACVAVHSDPDAEAPHVRDADEAVRLPGERSTDTYLRIDAVVDAAIRTGADAVHPGYGFLSENAAFARACESAGLTWVGPPPSAIEAMGSKLAAKATMREAGVPVLPTVEVDDDLDLGGTVAAPGGLGWPVIVKASAGGGGRGMRVVEDAARLAEAVESARREARASFGDPTLFLEPYARRPRHIEVQVLADNHGAVVHLFERECSIQRRHQKIIEESPSVRVDATLRSQLGDAAVRSARAIGYVNAGTVEFLLLEDGSFAFLEMNTRLQVEHTVTELVTGLDLVRLQLLVAEGWQLGEDVLAARHQGHAIEARLYAEDPAASWRPSAGLLHRFRIPTAEGPPHDNGLEHTVRIRVDSGVEDGSTVTTHYDPLLAKVVAHAATRDEAARALARVLQGAELHGLTTNRDLLVRTLRHREFLEGEIDTGFLERHDPAEIGAPLATMETERLHALCAALSAQARRRESAQVLRAMPSGWRNVPASPQLSRYEGRENLIEVGYSFDRKGRLVQAEVDGKRRDDLELLACTPEQVRLVVGGSEKLYRVQHVGPEVFVDGPDGSSSLHALERFPVPSAPLQPGSLLAPLPGTVVKVAVSPGARVRAGEVLVAIEAMKMEHELRAPADGAVEVVNVAPGDQVEAGTVLVVVDAETP